MVKTQRSTISEFLSVVAAKQSTPGGGAVTALVGALAAAIGEMALNYSIGRKATPQFDAELSHVLGELTRARTVMLELVVEDQEAFAALTDAKKLPETDATRRERIAAAVEVCIAVPRTIGATALTMLRVVEPIVEKSNRWLLSDLAVCVELAMATVRAAQYSVRANLNDVEGSTRDILIRDCDDQVARGVILVNAALKRVKPFVS